MELDAHDFDLRDCVEGVLDVFAEKASKIDLVYQIDHSVPPQIIGDSLRYILPVRLLIGCWTKATPSR
jgi:signal transduction histidine kinase